MNGSIGLYAPASRRTELAQFVAAHRAALARFHFLVPGDLAESLDPSLRVERLCPAAEGGLIQMAGRIPEGGIHALFCLFDSTDHPLVQEDLGVLLRMGSVREIPFATNFATAEILAEHLRRRRVGWLIFNPVAGAGRAAADLLAIRRQLEPAMDLVIRETSSDCDADQIAREAIAAHADCVLAAGGDGTVSLAAQELTGTEIPLGIIPRGTANALAVCLLGLGANLSPIPTACQAIVGGVTKRIDTATANGRPMLLLGGFGFEAGMVENATREMKTRYGALAYLLGGWTQMAQHQDFKARIEVDGKVEEVETGTVVVANAAPPTSVLAQGQGQPVLDDGLLDVTIVTGVATTWAAVETMLRLFNAGLFGTDAGVNVVHLLGRKIRVETEPAQPMVLDGEPAESGPVEFECMPRSLSVFTLDPGLASANKA